MKSGFIAPENLSLMRIVDLPGGEADNADESKAGEWGLAVVKALQEWSTAVCDALAPARLRSLTWCRMELGTGFRGPQTMYDFRPDATS